MKSHQPSAEHSNTQASQPAAARDVPAPALVDQLEVHPMPIQCSLTVGAADDPLEHEADTIADQVMRMPDPSHSFISRKAISIQRVFDEREEGEGENKEVVESRAHTGVDEEEQPGVQRKPLASFIQKKESASAGIASSEVSNSIEATRGGGAGMDDGTRSFMESRFGADFSDVRIHTGDYAVQMSRDLSAQAFTVGNDVYFNSGKYAPESSEGRHLLAHELTHTIQQSGSIKPKRTEGSAGQTIQRSFFGDIWHSITSAASAVWSGITTAASAVWSGIRAFGNWAWNVIRSAGAWVWDLITWMPNRLWALIRHLGQGVADIALWIADIVRVIRGDEGLLHWLGRALRGGAAWVGRFFAKVMDIMGAAEFWTLVTNVIKFNSRPLTDVEREEVQKVYGNFVSYWQVRIDEYSLISLIGATAKHSEGMGVTTGHTINFNRTISASPGNDDMAWLMHEMGHVAQYTAAGIQYMGEAIHAQATVGYDYGGGAALAGKDLRDFNREQQPDILKDYYKLVLTAPVPSIYAADYVRMKDQAQRGEF